jgi:amino acid adenylation domain-containing protein
MPDQTNSSKAKRDLLEKYLRGEIPSCLESRNGIAPRETGNIAPVSVTQQQVWLHHHIVPENVSVYNETLTIHRTGPLDPAVLERCLREIVRRHEIWRTTFDGRGEELVQIVHPAPQTFPLQVIDLSQVPEADHEAEALRLATEDARRPFDLKTGPLLRALLISLSDQQHRIYMTLHHLIFDAVTAYRVLVPELGALYEAFSAGQASPLTELHLQYADFACWQRRSLSPAISSEHEAYWRKQMARELPLCQWPNERPRPTVQTHRGAIERFAFPATLVQRLRVLSQQAGVSLYMTLLAGFVAMLKRYTDQDEILIGSLTAGRNRVELEQMMGHFVNPLALRFDVSGNPTFRELQLQVRNVVLEGLAHESVPFSRVVELAQQRNDPSRHPLFQIIFSQQPQLQHVTPGWELRTEEVSNGGSKLDLTVVIDDRGDAVSGPITYNPDLFDVSTIRRAVEHWQTLLEGAADDASWGILDLPILTERERNQILFDWNQTALELPRSKTLCELFEDQVTKTPDAVAITFGDQSLTYQELNQRADQVARRLQSLGVGPDVPVGLFVERSFEMMAGILGILKAGGACLPLDPAHPAERLSFILGEMQAPVVLTHSRLRDQLPAHNGEVICLDREREFRGEGIVPSARQAESATNIAYVIYTSGSTGHPKGVRVTHSGLVNSTLARTAYYRETLRSFLLLSSFTFDSSLAGIFWTLSVGGTLVLPPDSSQWELDSLSFLIEKHQISHLLCVPSLYQTLIQNSPIERLASLKVAIVAGESCPVALVEEHYRRLPHAALYNEYGPTEATVWCSAYRCEPQAEAIRVPIGRPIANTQLYVLDSRMQMVPVGVPGELLVGGAGVAGGYWKRPDLTAEKFITNPFRSTPGARLYKTGDLARFLPDGNIDYLGRVDHQVKLRGFRIELGDIEAALASHPAVQEAVVVAREDVPGEKRLVAYYTASNADAKATGVAKLRAHLSSKLPDYMVPAAYVQMERMPLTANGKLDRKALPVPGGGAYAVRGYEAPQGEIEMRLAQIWADVLKIDRFGRNDNFFELGGHSLLAMQVMVRIRRVFELELPVRSMFEADTIAGLAGELQKAQALGFKARAHMAQLRPGSPAASPSREALLAQLDNLSAAELQSLLQHVRDDKHSP